MIMEEGIDGFIGTLGEQMWYIDTIAEMVCGRHCIMSDPNFYAGPLDPVADSYTLEQLKPREQQ